jgi:hypothetical protein
MKWIWPLSWYFRIKELERANIELLIKARKWEDVARAAAIAQCAMTAAYVSSAAAMCGSLSTYRPPQGPKL